MIVSLRYYLKREWREQVYNIVTVYEALISCWQITVLWVRLLDFSIRNSTKISILWILLLCCLDRWGVSLSLSGMRVRHPLSSMTLQAKLHMQVMHLTMSSWVPVLLLTKTLTVTKVKKMWIQVLQSKWFSQLQHSMVQRQTIPLCVRAVPQNPRTVLFAVLTALFLKSLQLHLSWILHHSPKVSGDVYKLLTDLHYTQLFLQMNLVLCQTPPVPFICPFTSSATSSNYWHYFLFLIHHSVYIMFVSVSIYHVLEPHVNSILFYCINHWCHTHWSTIYTLNSSSSVFSPFKL